MKSILISLVFFFLQSEQNNEYYFFRIDEDIPLENISFGKKEVERWNRNIKVKSGKRFEFKVKIENQKYSYILDSNSILKFNTITLQKLTDKTNEALEISRGDVILNYKNPKAEETDFKIKVECFGPFFYEDKLMTKSEKINIDLNQNSAFFSDLY